jgi:hypothetical protein
MEPDESDLPLFGFSGKEQGDGGESPPPEPRARDYPPAHRRDDPETSAEADRKIHASGKVDTQSVAIVRWLVAHGGRSWTYREISKGLGWEPNAVARRMQGCREKGPWTIDGCPYWVWLGASRICAVGGASCGTYEARDYSYRENKNGD